MTAEAYWRAATSPTLDLVAVACRAPSVHNTQPWRWRVRGTRIELWADRSRQLLAADPSGRSLTISCGAALHHLTVAAAAGGWLADVERMPEPVAAPDLLAVVRLTPGHRSPRALSELRALYLRATDRRRFTSWPVPATTLERLAASGSRPGAVVVPLTDVSARFRVELLVARAVEAQEADPRYAEEQGRWIDRSNADGIPAGAVPAVAYRPRSRRTRFGHGLYPDAPQEVVESSDGIVCIGTGVAWPAADGPLAWLEAGEALSATWLGATMEGLSLVPLSQAIEVDDTRIALQHDVLHGRWAPQLLARIGWQELGRSAVPRTPRRPLAEVLID